MSTRHLPLLILALTGLGIQSPAQTDETVPEKAAIIETLPQKLPFFPVGVQFSPVPSGKGWKGEEGPISQETIRDTIDNMIEHGFTGIEGPTHRPPEEEAYILQYAQEKGLFVTWHAGALENFGRDNPPEPCVYSPNYAEAVRKLAEERLAPLKDIPRLYNVFIYQDEPFTAGEKSFGFGEELKAEFKKRYGYDLPQDVKSVFDDPKKLQELLDFRTAKFPDGWRQTYSIVKSINNGFKATLTHDSHNTFGAGYGSHAEIAIDDIFHWGGDFADLFVFDIYPYMMFDFRFGEMSRLPKPRVSQIHYSFAQMRNLTSTHEKDLGFWFGTYNPAFFAPFLCPELQAMHWSEREMSATAVAAGANYLLSGYKVPIDAGHWESLGEGLRLLQKTRGRLLETPKIKAKAAMLFPRSHYLLLQEEYFNVGISFELFMRAFGELDILHEDQITDETMNGYEILVLFDVKLLPRPVAQRIAAFVERGGTVIADCVPQLDEMRQPMDVMTGLFGVEKAETGRIKRSGSWVPYKTQDPMWFARPADAPDESVFPTDTFSASTWSGPAPEHLTDFLLVSPRPCQPTDALVLARTASGQPAVTFRQSGKGQSFLLGFCVQDTYFKTWQDENTAHRDALRALIAELPRRARIRAHVHSSNPDIEASVRANNREGFLFLINHEAAATNTTIGMADLGFSLKRLVDLQTGQDVSFKTDRDVNEMDIDVPPGQYRLFEIRAE